MSAVQESRNREVVRLERSGWATNAALRQRLEAVGLRPPAEVVAECLNEGVGNEGGAGACWAWAEHVVTRLKEHFAPFRFFSDIDYGPLAIPTNDRFGTCKAMDLNIRRDQQPDLAEDFVDPVLGEGVDLAGSAGAGGTMLAKDGRMVVAGVAGQYGISTGSHEDVTAAVELLEADGVDTRTLMARQIWGARFLQCPPGLVPDSDYAERWTSTLLPVEGLVDRWAVSGTMLERWVRFRLGKVDRGIGSVQVSPALPLT